MARSTAPNIPPEYLAAFVKLFPGQFTNPHTGPILPDATTITRTPGPDFHEPPHVPTTEQLAIRAAFTTVGDLLDAAPYNERHAYWALAQASGMHEVHYYRHRHIANVYRGQNPADIPRPLAITMPHSATWWSMYVQLQHPSYDRFDLAYDIEIDPGTARINAAPYPSAQYYVWERYGIFEPLYTYHDDFPLTFNPTTRTRYTGLLTFPARSNCEYREIWFWRNIAELAPVCVIWSFTPTIQPAAIIGYQTYPFQIYPEKWPNE